VIRQAKKEDGEAIVDLLMVIFRDMQLPFLAKYGEEKTKEIMLVAMDEEDYRYNYHRGIIEELNGAIAGVAFGYPAEDEKVIDEAFTQILPAFDIDPKETIFTDSESLPGEWYLDSISVAPNFRGHGVGTKLLRALPKVAKQDNEKIIGLNVDVENTQAEKLYKRSGFQVVAQVKIAGHKYKHMQKVL
jgi:ribosomal protein S18 acetylase RimI-like enzyme